MRTIWKFPLMDGRMLSPQNGYALDMPRGARVVYAEHQGESGMCLWAEVDPEARRVERRFVVIGTGHEVPDGATHVHSWQSPPWVWHLYEMPS